MRITLFLVPVMLFATALPSSAQARSVAPPGSEVAHVNYPGMQRLQYRYGPIQINPGQNSIRSLPTGLHPKVPGFVTRFEPNLVRVSNNKPIPAGMLHVHHGVWLLDGKPTFAAGEEKTVTQAPRGFGVFLTGREVWAVNYMLHNLISSPEKVYLTWQLDFVPASSVAGRSLKPSFVQWMDVAGSKPKLYPVFDAMQRKGDGGRFTFPDDARGAQRKAIGRDQKWRVDRDVTLVYAVAHMHPGGLFTSMYATRGREKRMLFRSKVKYFSKSKYPSWDIAITSTPPEWRIKLKRGDVVSIATTVDTSSASWRDSMGIMPPLVYPGHDAGGVDPFTSPGSIPRRGVLTHLSLPENRVPGGLPSSLPDPRSLPDGPQVSGPVAISGFRYQLGDLNNGGRLSLPPVVREGGRLSFVNLDATRTIPPDRSAYHTITACKAPCTYTTGASFPREDGAFNFDSGQLGFGPSGATPSANRNAWSTPTGLTPGTYSFFCRVHPFMRGAFRVKRLPELPASTGWPALPQGEVGV